MATCRSCLWCGKENNDYLCLKGDEGTLIPFSDFTPCDDYVDEYDLVRTNEE